MTNQKSDYSKKLLDPRWQKKRLEILERDRWMCSICGDNENTLHVHHMVYLKGKEPWDIPSEYLNTLCEGCHEHETSIIKDVLDSLNHEVKSKFFAGDIINLAHAFHRLVPYHCSEVFSSVIEYWFRTPELVKEMYDRYFEYLSSKRKGNNSNESATDMPF